MKVKTINLPLDLFEWLEGYRWKHKIPSVNETIRQILDEKREAEEKGRRK